MASGDGYLASWDVDAGNPEKTTVAATVKGQEYLLPDLAFSADGRTAALLWYVRNRAETGTPQGGNQVLLFDVSDPVQPKFRMAMPVSAGKQGRVVISPDGRWLAVGSLGGFPHVWDLSAQDIAASEQRPPVMSGETQALAFSPDSRRLAMGSAAGTLAIWSPLGLGHLEQIENRNPISCLVWLPDGRVATGTENGLLLLWETDPDKLAELARRVAGRELSDAERERFGVLAR
jgi:WD40 repeat protein